MNATHMIKTLGAAVALTIAGGASAASVGTIPNGASNEFLAEFYSGSEVEGWYGANLGLNAGSGGATLTFEFFGSEASYKNAFEFDGSVLFSHPGDVAPHFGNTFADTGASGLDAGDALFSTSVSGVMSGIIDFRFLIDGFTSTTVDNGTNPDDVVGLADQNFFLTFDSPNYSLDTTIDGVSGTYGNSVFVFLDDAGAGPDDNHDDMVVRISVTGGTISVAEPFVTALIGFGAIALVGANRRRRV